MGAGGRERRDGQGPGEAAATATASLLLGSLLKHRGDNLFSIRAQSRQERAQHTETEINGWKTDIRGAFAANQRSQLPSVADNDARR